MNFQRRGFEPPEPEWFVRFSNWCLKPLEPPLHKLDYKSTAFLSNHQIFLKENIIFLKIWHLFIKIRGTILVFLFLTPIKIGAKVQLFFTSTIVSSYFFKITSLFTDKCSKTCPKCIISHHTLKANYLNRKLSYVQKNDLYSIFMYKAPIVLS